MGKFRAVVGRLSGFRGQDFGLSWGFRAFVARISGFRGKISGFCSEEDFGLKISGVAGDFGLSWPGFWAFARRISGVDQWGDFGFSWGFRVLVVRISGFAGEDFGLSEGFQAGRLEGWRAGRLEGWRAGRKAGRLGVEGWKLAGRAGGLGGLEGWRAGGLEGWKAGRLGGWPSCRLARRGL